VNTKSFLITNPCSEKKPELGNENSCGYAKPELCAQVRSQAGAWEREVNTKSFLITNPCSEKTHFALKYVDFFIKCHYLTNINIQIHWKSGTWAGAFLDVSCLTNYFIC
jgi:hypothetical protein